jgi:hypothetical protein
VRGSGAGARAAHTGQREFRGISQMSRGNRIARPVRMVWFLEREQDRVVCEIRRSELVAAWEFQIAPANEPPRTYHFESPTKLIETYLRQQMLLRAQGWRPKIDVNRES